MNRVWTALLLLATVVVAGAVVYVVAHNDKVSEAGDTPGFSDPPTTSAPSTSAGAGPSTSKSKDPSGSGSATGAGTGTGTGTTSTAKVHTVVFLGDNWALGDGTTDKKKRFANLVADSLGAKSLLVVAKEGSGYAKKGPGGQSYLDVVDNVVSAKPDLVVVTGGRNDISDDVNTLGDATDTLFNDLSDQLPDAMIVAVKPFWGDSAHPSDLAKVDAAVKAGVTQAGGTFLDIPDPISGHNFWMANAANPNDHGNQAIADALTPKLEALLGSS